MSDDLISRKEIKMKTCPFCGSPGKMDYIALCEKPYFPQCSNGECIVSDTAISFSTKEEAVEAWNKRVGEQDE